MRTRLQGPVPSGSGRVGDGAVSGSWMSRRLCLRFRTQVSLWAEELSPWLRGLRVGPGGGPTTGLRPRNWIWLGSSGPRGHKHLLLQHRASTQLCQNFLGCDAA